MTNDLIKSISEDIDRKINAAIAENIKKKKKMRPKAKVIIQIRNFKKAN